MSNRDPKEVILDAALAVFAKVGSDRTTVGLILARAGISNGALFHHFASKEAIAEALYLRGIACYQAGLVKALDEHRGVNAARTTVKAAVRHHLAWVEANRDLAWFMYEHGRPDWQPAHGTEVRKLNRETADHVRDWMAPLVRAGAVRDLPLIVLAAFVNGPAHFVARRWLSGLSSVRPTSFTDLLADAAWAAIAPHRTRALPATPPRASPAALIEAAALEAARSNVATSAPGEWSVAHLTMSSTSQQAASGMELAVVRSVSRESDSHLAMIEVDLIDPDGRTAARGNVVCIRRGGSEDRTEY